MPELRKILVFLFVSLLLIYTFKLLYATRYKKDKSYIFIIMICGLFLLVVATFSDMIASNACIAYIYVIIKLCFTLGSILYIIGIILWMDFTKKIIDELEKMASTDSLTGMLNRNGLLKVFDEMIKNMRSFSILVCDLDGTKLINDNLGHIEGDQFIFNSSQIMVDSIRDHGNISRFGGDEFIILLKDQELQEVETIIDNIKMKILKLYPQYNSGVSIGYSSFPQDGQSFDDLFKAADTRMYRDKKRNIQ